MYGVIVEGWGLEVDKFNIESKCPHLLAVWLWQFSGLNLNFLIYSTEIIIPQKFVGKIKPKIEKQRKKKWTKKKEESRLDRNSSPRYRSTRTEDRGWNRYWYTNVCLALFKIAKRWKCWSMNRWVDKQTIVYHAMEY